MLAFKKEFLYKYMKRDPSPHSPRPWHGAKPSAAARRSTVNPQLTCASPRREREKPKLPPRGFACPDCTEFVPPPFYNQWKKHIVWPGLSGFTVRVSRLTGCGCYTSHALLVVGVGSWSRRCPWKRCWPKTLQVPSLGQPQNQSKANASFQPLTLQTCQQRQRPHIKNFSPLTVLADLSHPLQTHEEQLTDPHESSDHRQIIAALDPPRVAR